MVRFKARRVNGRMLRFSCSAISVMLFCISSAVAQPSLMESIHANAVIDKSGFRGAMLVRDLHQNSYIAAHSELIHERYIPASTFKMFSALVALETGVIASKDSVIEWDGVTRERAEDAAFSGCSWLW